MVPLQEELIMSLKEPFVTFMSVPACLSHLIKFERTVGARTLRCSASLNQPRRSLCKTVTSNRYYIANKYFVLK